MTNGYTEREDLYGIESLVREWRAGKGFQGLCALSSDNDGREINQRVMLFDLQSSKQEITQLREE